MGESKLEQNREPLRIAMIGHKRVPGREGGIEAVVEELALRMTALGHDITLYNRRGQHTNRLQYDRVTDFQGVRIVWVPTLDRSGLAAVTSSFFATVLALFGRYDCLHYHAEGPCAMLPIAHLFGKRTVATIHGLDWSRGKWGGFASWYLRLGERGAAKYADAVIVLSRNMQQYFHITYGRDTVYIPNGIEKKDKLPARIIRDQWDLFQDGYFLFVGRIVPEKGLDYLIDAFKRLHTKKKLVVAGGSSDSDSYCLRIQEKAYGDSRIIFTGFVQGQMLQELYSNAYAYLLPSDVEGMPLTLLEAMSYGNCCVTSDIPECIEVVGAKALTFAKGDREALKAVMQKLCDSPAIVDAYRAGSSDFICNGYKWDAAVKQTLQVYDNAATSPRRTTKWTSL